MFTVCVQPPTGCELVWTPFVNTFPVAGGPTNCHERYQVLLSWHNTCAERAVTYWYEIWVDTDGDGSFETWDYTSPSHSFTLTVGDSYWLEPTLDGPGAADYTNAPDFYQATFHLLLDGVDAVTLIYDDFLNVCS